VRVRKQAEAQAETRRRLLEAAGELFAERGFRLASTREICRKAGADIAAIHYHFGNKENLYEAVLQYADSMLTDAAPAVSALREKSPEARLRAMIEWVLTECFAQGQSEWRWKFVEHATIDLPPSLLAFFRSKIVPMFGAFDSLCREFLGQDAPDAQVRLARRSILGQCLYYRHFRTLIRATDADETFSPKGLRELTDHITAFSLAGLKQQARQLKAKRTVRVRTALATASRSRPRK